MELPCPFHVELDVSLSQHINNVFTNQEAPLFRVFIGVSLHEPD